jgi:AraC-like DNA-binding protein
MPETLDQLLTTLDVRVHAVALCDLRRGGGLVFEPMGMVTVHYVLQGSGLLQVGEAPPVSFEPHSVLIVPPGGMVRMRVSEEPAELVPAAEAMRMVADGLLGFEAGGGAVELLIVSGTITATYAGGFGLFDRLSEPLVENVAGADFLAAAFDLLLTEVRNPGLASRAFTETLMRQCLLMILRSHHARAGEGSPLFANLQDPRLSRAVTAVLQRPGEHHTLNSLATEAGMSRSVFGARFAEVYGQTPFAFVLKVRLRHAAHLLRSTDLPVKMIATAAGFPSRTHFSRAFRAAFNLDPTRYRKLLVASDAVSMPAGLDGTDA